MRDLILARAEIMGLKTKKGDKKLVMIKETDMKNIRVISLIFLPLVFYASCTNVKNISSLSEDDDRDFFLGKTWRGKQPVNFSTGVYYREVVIVTDGQGQGTITTGTVQLPGRGAYFGENMEIKQVRFWGNKSITFYTKNWKSYSLKNMGDEVLLLKYVNLRLGVEYGEAIMQSK